MPPAPRPIRIAPLAQGLLFVTTGLWPILHYRSFEAVTGPKTDDWLVKTLGGVLAVLGGALLIGALERTASRAWRLLGAGSAAALATADVLYVARGRLRPVYLLDAVAEAALVAAWLGSRPVRGDRRAVPTPAG
jgi:hypothetical protein